MYYRTTKELGIALVYDITDRNSFLDIEKWLEDCYEKVVNYATYILIGSKCDLEDQRQVSYEEGNELAQSLGIDFFETSAKESLNVNEAFQKLAFKMVQKYEAENKKTDGNIAIKSISSKFLF